MDNIIEMEQHDVWAHAKMEEEERQQQQEEALIELCKIADGWVREIRG